MHWTYVDDKKIYWERVKDLPAVRANLPLWLYKAIERGLFDYYRGGIGTCAKFRTNKLAAWVSLRESDVIVGDDYNHLALAYIDSLPEIVAAVKAAVKAEEWWERPQTVAVPLDWVKDPHWTKDPPTTPGWYVMCPVESGLPDQVCAKIAYGDWRKAQNPSVLYVSFLSRASELEEFEARAWYGPLPEIEE